MDKKAKGKKDKKNDVSVCNDQLGENSSGSTSEYDLKGESCNGCSKK